MLKSQIRMIQSPWKREEHEKNGNRGRNVPLVRDNQKQKQRKMARILSSESDMICNSSDDKYYVTGV